MRHPIKASAQHAKRFLVAVAVVLWAFPTPAAEYYVSPSGDDATGNGSAGQPWQTVSHAIGQLSAGDTLHLEGGATFSESVYFAPGSGGTAANPIVLTSPAANRACIQAPDNGSVACYIYNTAGLRFESIRFVGSGMDVHANDGVNAYADDTGHALLQFDGCEFSGFGKNGLVIGGWGGVSSGFRDVSIEDCVSCSNRTGGISLYGQYATANSNVVVRGCSAHGNLGDPAAGSHTGSGIVLGAVIDGLIEECAAYGNGRRCVTVGGPVGIWTYQSTRVTIQLCEAYSNKAVNADGGGFDLDGGCQDCMIQYCYSHDNDGAGYLLAQYSGARSFADNTVRYNISQNDGRRQDGYGGIHFWSSGSSGGIQDTLVYGNTVYSDVGPAVRFQNTSGQTGTRLCNNLLVTSNDMALVSGNPTTGVALFQGNGYGAMGVFSVAGHASLAAWRAASGQEMENSTPVGVAADPLLEQPGHGGTIGDPYRLSTLSAYRLQLRSPMIDAGLDVGVLLGTNPGSRDYYGHAIPGGSAYDIGAHERYRTGTVCSFR